MSRLCVFTLATLLLTATARNTATLQVVQRPETVAIHNGSIVLHALLWRPEGRGPFPAILQTHGSGRSPEELKRLGPYEQNAYVLGPVFARHGYAFLYLFRRGVGLSRDQGSSAVDLLNAEAAARGQDARNRLQLDLLEQREMGDALAGLAFLRALPDVDRDRIGLVGHSFGGSLALLMAEREPSLKAVVIFSAAGYSWDRSPPLRARLLAAVSRTKAPVMLIHAGHDFSTAPGKALDARLSELGKPHVLRIYPVFGDSAEEGHNILHLGVSIWEADVFAFLDEHMRF